MKYPQESVANGWKDHEHFKKDKDLDALREREDFKKLLAEMERAPASEKK